MNLSKKKCYTLKNNAFFMTPFYFAVLLVFNVTMYKTFPGLKLCC